MRNLKDRILLIALGVAGVASAAFAQSGEELFDEKCLMCHIKTKPTPEARSGFVAPPAMGVMFHVKEAFDGDKAKVIAFIKDYAHNPSRDKAKCMARSIERFGLMPSQKESVTQEELEKIAEYMYDNFPKKGFSPKHEGI